MNVLIVESPTKIKTISKYLSDDYIIISTIGHIINLKKNNLKPNELSFNKETFEPEYIEEIDKKDVIKNIKNKIKNNNVIIATDKDREGEMIAWSIQYLFKLKNPKRIIFTSITENEIKNALKNQLEINNNIVEAQKARRILDRIAGFCISGILSRTLEGAKSAGRVQSIIVKIINDKEKEINEFNNKKQSTYFYVNVNININNMSFLTKLVKKINNKEINNKIINFTKDEEEQVINIINKISKSKLTLFNLTSNDKKCNPQNPFTTSTLQQASSIKLKFNSKKTMLIAQKLYEMGHITYIRTDSIIICNEAMIDIENLIKEKYGENYYEKRI